VESPRPKVLFEPGEVVRVTDGPFNDFTGVVEEEPDILRFGFAPLYNSYKDAVRAAEILADIVESGRWKDEKFRVRSTVT
ncbi:MAG: KOW motif-containing protein, partial [Rhizobiaceae bacterium]|nr:KOW motif-containing protein [Rhizobiaceae bacterium]